jgi:hypothetical protein
MDHLCLLATVIAFLVGSASSQSWGTPSVICNAKGFLPTFTFTPTDQTHTVKIDFYLANEATAISTASHTTAYDGVDPTCKVVSKSYVLGEATVAIDKGDIDTTYADPVCTWITGAAATTATLGTAATYASKELCAAYCRDYMPEDAGIDGFQYGNADAATNCFCVKNFGTADAAGTYEICKLDFATTKGMIPYGTVDTPTCGGVLAHVDSNLDTNLDIIEYQVHVVAIVRRSFRDKVERLTKTPFKIKCKLTRDVANPFTSDQGFKVADALVDVAASTDISDTFEYRATLNFYDSTFVTAKSGVVRPKNNDHAAADHSDKLYMKIEQDANQELYSFVVNKCYATPTDASGHAQQDDFFKDQCHADSTITAYTSAPSAEAQTKFELTIQSFSFPNNDADTIYFHCKLFVCLNSAHAGNAGAATPACTQKLKTWCNDNNPNTVDVARRRRSADEDSVVGTKMVTSQQAVVYDHSQIVAPSCGHGFIFDRVLEECSNENLMEIKGVYLGAETWNPSYSNTSSKAFKQLAAKIEYQLFVLIRMTGRANIIHGMKVIWAKQGSVILGVLVKYAPSVSAAEAFNEFRDALQTKPSVTRVVNVLQIRSEKRIEYVPYVARQMKPDTEKLILIVVVVVLFVVVFIAGVTLFKVKQVRQRSNNNNNNNNNAAGFENKGVDA